MQFYNYIAQLSEIIAEIVLYILAGMSVISIGVAITKYLQYRREYKLLSKISIILDKIKQRKNIINFNKKEIFEAINSLENEVNFKFCICSSLLDEAISEFNDIKITNEPMNLFIEGMSKEASGELRKKLLIVGTIGSIAVYVGLFGTVMGIINAFHKIGLTGQGDMKVIMMGISQALVATALGLCVAIPGVVLYNWMNAKVKAVEVKAESCVKKILALRSIYYKE